jgi:hypothetical protein
MIVWKIMGTVIDRLQAPPLHETPYAERAISAMTPSSCRIRIRSPGLKWPYWEFSACLKNAFASGNTGSSAA